MVRASQLNEFDVRLAAMNTEQMPLNWQPKAWPETVEYQGHVYTYRPVFVKGRGMVEYWNEIGGWSMVSNPFFLHAMFQQVENHG